MSRSYKKFTVNKDANNKFCKRQASKKVRRIRDMPNGKRFKRYYCSWDISDWRFVDSNPLTAERFRRKWMDENDKELAWARNRFRTWKEAYRYWLRGHRMK